MEVAEAVFAARPTAYHNGSGVDPPHELSVACVIRTVVYVGDVQGYVRHDGHQNESPVVNKPITRASQPRS